MQQLRQTTDRLRRRLDQVTALTGAAALLATAVWVGVDRLGALWPTAGTVVALVAAGIVPVTLLLVVTAVNRPGSRRGHHGCEGDHDACTEEVSARVP